MIKGQKSQIFLLSRTEVLSISVVLWAVPLTDLADFQCRHAYRNFLN